MLETPHSLEAEQAVLGAIMIDPETMKTLSGYLATKDFFRDLHQWIWEAALSLHHDGQSCDQISVLIWMKKHDKRKCGILASKFDSDGRHYLSTCVGMCPSVVFAPYWAQTVKEMSERREQIVRGNMMAEDAYNNTNRKVKKKTSDGIDLKPL